jgi:hypothetical protein
MATRIYKHDKYCYVFGKAPKVGNASMQALLLRLRMYEEGYDNDTENKDIYQEWVNGKLSKILTKEEARKKYPDLNLSTKVADMGALLSALGNYVE